MTQEGLHSMKKSRVSQRGFFCRTVVFKKIVRISLSILRMRFPNLHTKVIKRNDITKLSFNELSTFMTPFFMRFDPLAPLPERLEEVRSHVRAAAPRASIQRGGAGGLKKRTICARFFPAIIGNACKNRCTQNIYCHLCIYATARYKGKNRHYNFFIFSRV